MDRGLYPNLREKFSQEGICPICLLEMKQTPKYVCDNLHTLCHRCKPYYFACPVCQSPLDLEPPPEVEPPHMPPPIHFMPHPFHHRPSAPPNDFLENERRPWEPPGPAPDQDLIPCKYEINGCFARVPEYLRELHEDRCQFRPFMEEEHLPTDLPFDDYDLVGCCYSSVGCNVMMPEWRKPIHEPLCIYKDRIDFPEEEEPGPDCEEDPEELVDCKLKIYGCLVRMPRRRKCTHELKCNYLKFYREEDFMEPEPVPEPEPELEPEPEVDPEERVPCRWAEHGCLVLPKFFRKESHEAKCNYRMEECAYKDNGCDAMFIPPRKHAHERSCEFQN